MYTSTYIYIYAHRTHTLLTNARLPKSAYLSAAYIFAHWEKYLAFRILVLLSTIFTGIKQRFFFFQLKCSLSYYFGF